MCPTSQIKPAFPCLLKKLVLSLIIKIGIRVFEAGYFRNVFLRFWVFEARLLMTKNFLIKATGIIFS